MKLQRTTEKDMELVGQDTLNPEELNAKVIIAKKFGRENP